MSENKKEFFNLIGYVKDRKKKIGYAYKTKYGSICIKADDMMDPMALGRLLKKGVYVGSITETGRKFPQVCE